MQRFSVGIGDVIGAILDFIWSILVALISFIFSVLVAIISWVWDKVTGLLDWIRVQIFNLFVWIFEQITAVFFWVWDLVAIPLVIIGGIFAVTFIGDAMWREIKGNRVAIRLKEVPQELEALLFDGDTFHLDADIASYQRALREQQTAAEKTPHYATYRAIFHFLDNHSNILAATRVALSWLEEVRHTLEKNNDITPLLDSQEQSNPLHTLYFALGSPPDLSQIPCDLSFQESYQDIRTQMIQTLQVAIQPLAKWAEKMNEQREFEQALVARAKAVSDRERNYQSQMASLQREQAKISDAQRTCADMDQKQAALRQQERAQAAKQRELDQLAQKYSDAHIAEKAAATAQAKVDEAALQNITKVADIPVAHFLDFFLAKLETVANSEALTGENQNKLLDAYTALKEKLEKNSVLTAEELASVSPDVHRINQIETIIKLYGEKIQRIKHDETLDDEEQNTQIDYLMRLRDRDIAALEE